MDQTTAKAILAEHLAAYRLLKHEDLERRIANVSLEVVHETDASGVDYTIETNIVWDNRRQRHIRVMADLSAQPQRPFLGFLPIYFADASDSFILAPDGTFIGE